ncbi:proline dehydrogenase family protein [Halomarina oriensis]|uniref:proline dehydrogenase n=1 Tax=Halomarina oriensis TaxID=671145 RepID=A0A6B0GJH6_9EURY|nr:proline dehydrogenase family protein [Halomarina oriensis]MWG34750.1 proline dehydrogenase [Halomarina oriensis]
MIPPVANRFVAGESAATVLDHARRMEASGVKSICNLLGEHYDERGPADEDTAAYRRLLRDIPDSLDACVSVKPSQLGIEMGSDVFGENLAAIVEVAAEEGRFVWVDMEGHDTIDATLDAFEAAARDYPEMGLCLQSNMKRTDEDLRDVAEYAGKIRLVKGAYDPPRELTHQGKDAVNEAYERHLEYLFREFEGGVAVGSHDPRMIDHAIELHEEYGTDFEIQMLMGVREDAQVDLAREYEVYQYVPYGDRWASYFYRRVLERKENALFALRAILS